MLTLIGGRRICCILSCHIWRLRLSGVFRLTDLTTLYLLAVQGRFAQLIAPSSFNEIMFKVLQLRAGGSSEYDRASMSDPLRGLFAGAPYWKRLCDFGSAKKICRVPIDGITASTRRRG